MQVDVRLSNPYLKSRDSLFSRVARAIAEAVILSNRAYLEEKAREGRPVPPLYRSGVYYQNEPEGLPDEALDIPAIMRQGHGDCLHLSAWRVAELRNAGEKKARIAVTRKRLGRGKRLFHVLVRRGNGKLEDPSKRLGM